jgi:hypothetical protein
MPLKERSERDSSTERMWRDPRRFEKYDADRIAVAFRGVARPLWILAVCTLVVILRQMREALIPLVLAGLITLIFSGVVERLRRLHVPRAVSALVLMLMGSLSLGSAELNPVIVFVALWLGGWLWGIAGILLALPVLVATRVAASQPGGHDVVWRILGPAPHKPSEDPTAKGSGSRIEIPTLRPWESR